MAEVWLARRADGAFKREVALKLPMMTRLRKDLEERFARERDILASLEHVHIARLYDAGTDAHGLPYLSMEYVAGQPITDWCDARKLDIRERLELMLQVLDGVQYAHERHVIHRDLKPSNILVTESGQVRLLDFGIAKLLETDEPDRTQLTNVYGRALTPDYASPELIRGDQIDARSDVYSLGVLLYELLTGIPPYRLKAGASVGTLEQAITTIEVRKPSTQIEPQCCELRNVTREKLARLLRGDLDVIVLKALAKDQRERYESAASMAEDLRRHSDSEAIEAQPPKFSYRMRKYLGRHRTGVAAAVLVAVAILATAGYEGYRIETDQDRKIAALPAAKPLGENSIAVLPFVDLSEKGNQEYFSDGLSEELIDLLTQVKDLQVIARTSSFYFKGKSVTVPQIARTLGVAQVLEGSVRKGANILRVTAQLIRADNGAHLWSQTFDRDVTDIFKVQDEIAAAVVEALKLKIGSMQPPKDPERSENPEAYVQFLLGRQLSHRGNLEGFRAAVAADRKAVALDPRYAAAYAALAMNESNAAGVSDDLAGYERAGAAADKAIELAPQLEAGYRARGGMRILSLDLWGGRVDLERALMLAPGDSRVQNDYGYMLATFGRLSEAIRVINKAIELDPINSNAWGNIGVYLTARHDYPGARRALERSLEISPEDSIDRADLGTLNLMEGRFQDALTEYERSGDEVLRLTGEAIVEHTLGNDQKSRRSLEQLIAQHASDSAYQVAQVYAWRGDNDKAFDWLQRAYQQHDSGMDAISYDPLLRGVRRDSRYAATLKQLKVTD